MINAKELLIDALPIIKEFAPTIAGAIGGLPGMALGYVIPVLAHAFGGKANDIPELASNILSNPNAKEILCFLEKQHTVTIQSLLNNLNDLAKAEITIKLEWDSGEP